jgi:disulfide bond formation protein DsbB
MNQLHALIEKSLSLPVAAKLLLFFNIGALLFALTMQFGFGVRPCILCLLQRIPYASVAVLSAITLAWKPFKRQTTVLLGLCAVIYLAGMGLAAFHTGVERHWWEGTTRCTAQPIKEGASVEEMREALLKMDEPRCDVISWSIFGLSMANFNVAGSLVLALFAAAVAARHNRTRK